VIRLHRKRFLEEERDVDLGGELGETKLDQLVIPLHQQVLGIFISHLDEL